ncbi:MAG: PAS domain S-box protein [Verrucomicrobiota bacterium]
MKANCLKQLQVLYGLALTFIALTLLSSSCLMQFAIQQSGCASRVINLSGRQRMLSQHLTKCVQDLENMADGGERTKRLSEVSESFASWKEVHWGLQHGDKKLGLPAGRNSPEITALFAEMEPVHAAMVHALEFLMAQVKEGGPAPGAVHATAEVLLRNESRFLELMDKVAFQFDKEARERIGAMQTLEWGILLVGLLVLLLEFLLVFRPSLSQLAGMMNSLKQQAEQIQKTNDRLEESLEQSMRVEKALRASESRLHQAQRIARHGNWELDLLTNTFIWSGEVFQLFEIDRERLGTSYEAFLAAVHPEDRAAVHAAYTQSLETRKPCEITHRLLLPDGRIKHVQEYCETTYSPEGKPVLSLGTIHDITAIKRSEQLLARERLLLTSLKMNIPDTVYVKDRNGRFLWVNDAKARLLGCSDSEAVIGKSDFDFFSPEHSQASYAIEQEIIATGQPVVDQEEKVVWPNGRVTWVSTTKAPLIDAEEKIVGLLGISRDLTTHKQAEEALRESEMLLREAQTVADLGCYVLNIPTGLWRSSDALDKVFGIDQAYDHSVEGWEALLHPDDRQKMVDYFSSEVLGQGRTFNKEYRIIRHDDQAERWVHGMGKLEFDGQGRPLRMLGTIQDITTRKQAEARLRLTSGALEAAANAIAITNNRGVVEWANTAYTTYTGYSLAETIGKTPSLLKSGKHAPAFYQNLWKTVLAGEVWQGEMINRRKDGSLYSEEMTITPMKDHRGRVTHFIAVKQDITERKQMEENLMRTQRIESIGTLASGIAHDLNNIITPIILSAEMLRAVEEPESRECLLSSIEECAQRGAAVVNQVLLFARGTRGDYTALQLNRLVEDMAKIAGETFPKNITISSSIPSGLWTVNGDATQIHQVLLNLCINARDAMPDGGTLHLSAENAEIDENFAAMVPEAKAGNYAMLAVSDTGTGIPRKYIVKIFDPFFTTKEVGKGTGIGLSTVIGIVRSHGGFITVESQEGRGSTFKVFLPGKRNCTAEPAHLPPTEILQGNGATILVVDDEASIAATIAMALKNNGFKVFTAPEGTAALALYKKHANEIDLVFTDVIMPGMDGVALSRALKAINPQVKILASTGQASDASQSELHALGVDVILRKPYDTKKLLTAIRDAALCSNFPSALSTTGQ